MAKSGLIRLEHEHEALRFISVTSDESFIQLRHDLIIQLGITILVSMLLALLIVTVTLNVTLTPLRRLLEFAHRTGGQDDQDFEPGKIREFNQLSQDIVSIMSALKNSEQRLVKYSGELEEAHQVQSSMVKKNRELLHRILTLQELERKHLAQELHDELGQSLAVISTDAYLIKSKVEQGSVVFTSAEAIHSSAREMYDIVYNRIKSLRPMPLDDLGLADAICFMPAVKIFQQRGIDLKMEITKPLDSLPDAVKIAVYRIVQEALTNIIKHAEASRAWLSLTTDPQTMRLDLEIRDDGIGISADQFNQPAGYGLSGIRERVYALKGECRIEGDGEGARINISLPYASGDHLDIDSEYVI
jgi:glucose-6-phosphate-specific signal transduction histidine kinase